MAWSTIYIHARTSLLMLLPLDKIFRCTQACFIKNQLNFPHALRLANNQDGSSAQERQHSLPALKQYQPKAKKISLQFKGHKRRIVVRSLNLPQKWQWIMVIYWWRFLTNVSCVTWSKRRTTWGKEVNCQGEDVGEHSEGRCKQGMKCMCMEPTKN